MLQAEEWDQPGDQMRQPFRGSFCFSASGMSSMVAVGTEGQTLPLGGPHPILDTPLPTFLLSLVPEAHAPTPILSDWCPPGAQTQTCAIGDSTRGWWDQHKSSSRPGEATGRHSVPGSGWGRGGHVEASLEGETNPRFLIAATCHLFKTAL